MNYTLTKDIKIYSSCYPHYNVTINQTEHQTIVVVCNGIEHTESFSASFKDVLHVHIVPDDGYKIGELNLTTVVVTENVTISASDPEPFETYITFTGTQPFTINTNDYTVHWTGFLYYSTDTKQWNEWRGSTIYSVNNKLYIRGIENKRITGSYNRFWIISTEGTVACTGNIENILDYTVVAQRKHPAMDEYCYNQLFYNCTSLTKGPELPAVTLSSCCYNQMFSGCTSLTEAPELPATTLVYYGCYMSMFSGCTSLTKAPELPAVEVAYGSYSGMFIDCTSLTKAPDLLAEKVDQYGYSSMFKGCTSLTEVQETLNLGNYTNHASCQSMFQDCISLTKAPALPCRSVSDNAYQQMFKGCTSLETAPELPANMVSNYGYHEMFADCINLKAAPDLPATMVFSQAYKDMFKNDTQITSVKVPASVKSSSYVNGFASDHSITIEYVL